MSSVSPALSATFKPIWVCDVDVYEALHDVEAERRADGGVFERALVVLRAGSRPLTTATIDLVDGVLPATTLRQVIEGLPGGALTAHRHPDERSATRTPSVTVVVCTRDRPAHLRSCLDQLARVPYPSLEVVVVDNAPSTDETARVVGDLAARDHRIRYVREDRPGLSYARNRGIAASSSEIVAFTDDDVRVDPRWVAALVEGFSQDDRIMCVTGSVFPASLETPSQALFERAVAFGTRWGFERAVFDLDEHRRPGALYPYQVGMFGAGNNMAFRRDHLVAMGGFDVTLGAGSPAHGGEDLDAFLRVVTGGWRLAYEPAAMVWHVHRQSDEELRTQAFRYGVGLGALAAKLLVSRGDRRQVVARVPRAVSYFFRPSSDKNAQKGKDFPLSLSLLELGGVVCGPVAYARSRFRNRAVA